MQTREEVRARLLKRFSYRWSELKYSVNVASSKGRAVLLATLAEVGEEVSKEVAPEFEAMAAEFAGVLAGVETNNLVADSRIMAEWEEQFAALREVNADLTRRRRLRAEALGGFQNDINADYANDFLKHLVLGSAKDQGTDEHILPKCTCKSIFLHTHNTHTHEYICIYVYIRYIYISVRVYM